MNTLPDLRHAARRLVRRPSFAITAIATIALAIAGNTMVFALIRGILLAPLPLPQPDRLVRIEQVHTTGFTNVTGATFVDIRGSVRTLDSVAGFRVAPAAVSAGDQALQLQATTVTVDYFVLLALPPAAGRLPEPQDFAAGSQPVVFLSADLWRRVFGGERSAIGRSILVGGAPRIVAGVVDVPASVPGSADIWLPYIDSSTFFSNRRARLMTVVARLRPGVTAAAASSELAAIAVNIVRQAPEAGADMSLRATPLGERVVASVRSSLLVLWGAVGVLLMIAFANVANLLLMEGSARERELALRSALGAPRGTLIRELTVEAGLLGLSGGALGATLGTWGVGLLRGLLPASLPRVSDVHADVSLIAVGTAVATLGAIVFGLVPAVRSSRRDAAAALRTRDAMPGGARLRDSLVAAEVALTIVLLFGAGLLGRTLLAIDAVPLGFDPHHVTTVDLSLPGAKYQGPAAHARFFSQVVDRLAMTPGVQSAGVTGALPLTPTAATTMIPQDGDDQRQPVPDVITVTLDIFRVFQMRMVHGRTFTSGDRAGAPAVAVINESAARELWPTGVDPIGRTIEMRDWGAPYVATVIGVVNDVRHAGADRPIRPAVYYPLEQFPNTTLTQTIVVRSEQPAEQVIAAVRGILREIDPTQPVGVTASMDARIAGALAPRRFNALLLAAFAAAALLLAAVGIYGIVAFAMAARTREIAIRMALGAPPRRIVMLTLGRGAGPMIGGAIAGLAGSWIAAAAMRSLVVGVPEHDVVSLVAAAALAGAAGLAAMAGPAVRAVRVDPATSFRST